MSTRNIPFLDLVTPHLELESELTSIFQQVTRTGGFIGGPLVNNFERAFAEFCETAYSIGVSSGTDALRLALIAAGVHEDEVVITVPHTFIATTEAISRAGALPEFVDIDEDTYNVDLAKLKDYLESQCQYGQDGKLISRRSGRPVTAVVPVHLYGQMADMDAIIDLAQRFGLMVIEDACQAHGAQYFSRKQNRWVKAGSIGRAAAFSFYPGKNLGACGEAGAVTTSDPAIAAKVKMLRDHGQAEKYYHDLEGDNARLDAVQAGILHVKLAHLSRWNEQRRKRAEEYSRQFKSAGFPVKTPYEPSWSRAVYHLYVVRTGDRAGLIKSLKDQGIGTGIHYPIPLHLQKAYAHKGYKEGDFPVAEKIAREVLSLPMFPQLEPEQQQRVVDAVVQCLECKVAS